MNEELMKQTTEDIELFTEEHQVSVEDRDTEIELIIDEDAIEVERSEDIEIVIDESIGWVGGDNTRHYSLAGRDEADQHPIKSITGLRDELDAIEALQTVYSDKIGFANYYEWGDGSYGAIGYFVSIMPSTSKVAICNGRNIFGVTVDNAAFVGGQVDTGRGRDHVLVVTSGTVDVRCESDVKVGDCVVPNDRGVATKTESDCGYKVLAINDKVGVIHATISLGVQACTTDLLGHSVRQLEKQLDDAEINIAAAMNTANEAYKKADNVVASKEIMNQQMAEVVDKVDNALTDIENMETQVEKTMEVTAQARAIAESAVVSAETSKNEAVQTANDALAKAGEIEEDVDAFISDWTFTDPITGEKNTGATYITEYIDNGLSTKAELETVEKLDKENKLLIEKNAENYSRMISSVDKYSVGEYSQAYGLTIEQAKSILKDGMIYIPTGGTHNETYNNTIGDPIVYSFTNGFYYIWDENIWMEGIGKVWFGSEQPSGDTYVYWFDDATLFILQDGKWIEVAVIAGNVNNRITSMVKQNVDNVSIEVSNATKAITSIDLRVYNTEAIMNSYVAWPSDESGQRFNVSLIDQSASQDKSSMSLSVYDKDGDKILKGAEIVLNQDGEDSFVQISADNIVMDGTTTFIKPEDLGEGGLTQIDGGRITTGIISANRIDVDNLKVKAANITGTLVVKNNTNTLFSADLTNNAVEIAGWKAYNGSLYSGTDFTNSTCFLCSKPGGTAGKMIIGGSGNISGWVFKAGDHFGVTNTGVVYANSGKIGGINLSANSLSVGQTLEYTSDFKANMVYNSSAANIIFTNTGWDNYVYDITGKSSVYVSQWTSGLVELFVLDHIPTVDETATVYSYHKCTSGDASSYEFTNSKNTSPAYLVVNVSPSVSTPVVSTTPSSFVLSSDGSLTCGNATLTGKIIASSGKIGGLNITNKGLTKSITKYTNIDTYTQVSTDKIEICPDFIKAEHTENGLFVLNKSTTISGGSIHIDIMGEALDWERVPMMTVNFGGNHYYLYIENNIVKAAEYQT